MLLAIVLALAFFAMYVAWLYHPVIIKRAKRLWREYRAWRWRENAEIGDRVYFYGYGPRPKRRTYAVVLHRHTLREARWGVRTESDGTQLLVPLSKLYPA